MAEKIDHVLYGRTSKDDRRRLTIENQQRALHRWATADDGISAVVGEFWDEGVSGKVPFFERPGGQRVAELLSRAGGKPVALTVLYTDRFARDTRSGLNVAESLSQQNALIVSVFEGIDLRRDKDPMLFQMRLVVAEAEWRRTNERTAAGKARAMERDGAPGNPFVRFGYLVGPRGQWEEHPAEGPIVRLIFNMADDGRNQCEIARWLDSLPDVRPGRRYGARGKGVSQLVPTRDGAHWCQATVGRILRQRGYTGFRVYAGRRFPVPQLVTDEQFQRVQLRIDGRSPRPLGAEAEAPAGFLSGLLTCGECGRKVYSSSTTRFALSGRLGMSAARYRCGGGAPGQLVCKAKQFRCHKLDGLVWASIEEYLSNPADVLRRALSTERETADLVDQLAGREDALEAAVKRCDAAVSEIWAMQARNGWALSTVEEGIKRIQGERSRALLEIEAIRAEARAAHTDQQSVRDVTAALSTVRSLAEAGRESARVRHEVARLLVAGGTVRTVGKGREREVRVELAYKWGDLVTAREAGESPATGTARKVANDWSIARQRATTVPVVFSLQGSGKAG